MFRNLPGGIEGFGFKGPKAAWGGGEGGKEGVLKGFSHGLRLRLRECDVPRVVCVEPREGCMQQVIMNGDAWEQLHPTHRRLPFAQGRQTAA